MGREDRALKRIFLKAKAKWSRGRNMIYIYLSGGLKTSFH